MVNPLLGVFLHAVGGFAAGSFYAPLKKVKAWSWETYWLVMGVAAWLVSPTVVKFCALKSAAAAVKHINSVSNWHSSYWAGVPIVFLLH